MRDLATGMQPALTFRVDRQRLLRERKAGLDAVFGHFNPGRHPAERRPDVTLDRAVLHISAAHARQGHAAKRLAPSRAGALHFVVPRGDRVVEVGLEDAVSDQYYGYL